jgi:hypothetical protein
MSSVVIDFAPRAAQLLILKRLDQYRFVVAVCHRRLGKTFLAVNWLIREALNLNIPGYRGYYFCSTQKQAKIVSWQYFKQSLTTLEQIGMVSFNETELRVDLPNGGKIYLGSAESIENYRGIYIDRIVLDEVASWTNAKYAYAEVLRPAMADRQAHALIIGTVKGLDQFYDFYQYGVSTLPDLEDWKTIDLKASATGILPEKELRMLRVTMSEGAYRREFENDFFADVPDVLITALEAIEAKNREVDKSLTAVSDVTVGIDIGLTGDPSMICIRQGREVRPFIEIPAEDPMLTASKIARILTTIKPYPTRIFGDAGQGQAVLSRVRDLGHNAIDVFFGSASDEINCFNKRAAMAYRVKTFLREGSIPHDDELIQEMVNQHLQEDPNNKIRLIKKRQIRDIIGRSPNKMDSLMLTFAEADDMAEDLHGAAQHMGVSVGDMQRLMRAMNVGQTTHINAMDYDVLDYMNGGGNH